MQCRIGKTEKYFFANSELRMWLVDIQSLDLPAAGIWQVRDATTGITLDQKWGYRSHLLFRLPPLFSFPFQVLRRIEGPGNFPLDILLQDISPQTPSAPHNFPN